MQALEKVYNNLSLFTSNLINSLVSLLKIVLQSRNKYQIPKINQNNCVILGNGPSLSKSLDQHTEYLKTQNLFCVNSYALTNDYELLKPGFYCLHDPGLWLSNNELPYKIFTTIKEKTTWPLNLYIPSKAKNSNDLQLISSNSLIKIIFYNYTIFRGFESIAFSFYKRNLAMPQSQNVLVASIFLAINSNFKNIYILGADHTWHENLTVNNENILCIKDVHYYDNVEHVNYRPFYKGLHLKETFKVNEIFEAWAKVFKGYINLNNYAKHLKVNIYNSSETSFIDAFERRKLE